MKNYCLTILGVVVILSGGCTSKAKTKDLAPANVTTKDLDKDLEMFTGDEVKSLLIELVEHGDNGDLQIMLPYLQDAVPELTEDGNVRIWAWTCNLKEKRFVFSVVNPDEKFLHEIWGVFERNADGKWIAKITGSHIT